MSKSINRDATTEQWIEQWVDEGDYRLDSIDLADIDRTRSHAVQNRSAVRLNEDHALRIGEWLDDASHTTPPIVVNKTKGRYVVIDGNHRAEAHGLVGRATIAAYVLTADQDTFEGMVLAANARSSLGLTPRERIELALHLADRIGTAKAAYQFQIKPDELQRQRRIHEAQRKVQAAVGAKPAGWADSKLEHLNRLDEDQLKALGRKNLETATANDVLQAVRNIEAVPAAQRQSQAEREAGRLEQIAYDKKKNPRTGTGSSRPKWTPTKIRNTLQQIGRHLAANPADLNDPAVREALDALQEVFDGPAEHAA